MKRICDLLSYCQEMGEEDVALTLVLAPLLREILKAHDKDAAIESSLKAINALGVGNLEDRELRNELLDFLCGVFRNEIKVQPNL